MFLGSVSKYCSNHASSPVVIVKNTESGQTLEGMCQGNEKHTTLCLVLLFHAKFSVSCVGGMLGLL